MVTRRVLRRQLRLVPGKQVNQLLRYLLAVASAKYKIRLHGFQVLGNHFHICLTYSQKRLPPFMQYLDSQLGRALNCHQGEWEFFWAPGSYNKIDFLKCAATTFKYLVYTLTNVVAAGLVPSAKEWPGVKVLPHEIGKRRWIVRCPDFFYDPDGKMPDVAILETSLPPIPGMTPDEVRARLITACRDRERALRQDRKDKGLGFVGRDKVLRQSPWGYPRSREPRRKRNPRVANVNKWARIEAIQKLQRFLEEYAAALAKFNDGDREVVFPSGTYEMQIQFNARCEDPAPT